MHNHFIVRQMRHVRHLFKILLKQIFPVSLLNLFSETSETIRMVMQYCLPSLTNGVVWWDKVKPVEIAAKSIVSPVSFVSCQNSKRGLTDDEFN